MRTVAPRVRHHLRKELPLEPLSLAAFKTLFDEYLERFFIAKERSLREASAEPSLHAIFSHTMLITQKGGKRIRPYLAYLSFIASGGSPTTDLFNALVGLELFHAFALVHDDIIDKSPIRHGIATVERYISDMMREETTKYRDIGTAQAILAGDMLFAWSYEAMRGEEDELFQRERLSLFDTMVTDVIVGQMLDVTIGARSRVTRDAIEEKNIMKTARYTFVSPLMIGATMAGHQNFFSWESLGLLIGTAYQLSDDLIDIVGEPKETGKERLGDVREGQHTYLTAHIFEYGTSHDIEAFMRYFGTTFPRDEEPLVQDIFVRTGAIEEARNGIRRRLDQAEGMIERSSMDGASRGCFFDLIDMLKKRIS